jgi:aspartate racemase
MAASRCLGLIGGLGVGAAIHYYRELAAEHQKRNRSLDLVMVHADVERVLGCIGDNDLAALANYLAGLITRLSRAGADVAAIPAVAPHICAPQLAELSPLPLMDLIAEVAREVDARGLKRVALFGTRYAIETNLFGRLPGVEIVRPQPGEIDLIHKAYTEIVRAGRGSAEQLVPLTEIAHTLQRRDGVEAILLAGTDLALLFDDTNTDFPAIDCARVHIDAIVGRLLGER